jgi:hypothetical protein
MKSKLASAFLLITLLIFGFIFGAMVATRIMTTSGMGFDQLADALGGMMIGSLGGLVVGIVLMRRLTPASKLVVGLLAIAVTVGTILYLRATPANTRVGEPVVYPPPAVESFNFTLETIDPYEGQRQDDPSLPWQNLRMASNLTFSYVALDAPDKLCIAPGTLNTEDGITRLRELRNILENLDVAGFPCDPLPCPSCTSVGLVWYLEQERFNISFDAACWQNEPALQPFRASVEEILANYSDSVTCELR